jgi:tripartite ATP-independent transporter DctP family solute receptor
MNAGRLETALLIIVTFLAASAGFCGRADAKTTLRMLGFLPAQHQLSKTAELFIKEVEKNSNGEIEIQHFPASQLYNHKSSIPVLQTGAVDMAIIYGGNWTGVVPSLEVIGFHGFFKNIEHARAVVDGYPGEVINKDFEEKAHLKVFGWYDYGKSEVCSKDPIIKLEDFKGKRIRSSGVSQATWVMALGAASVTIDAGEVYQALQRGTIDGAISGPSSFDQRKWFEVVKYATVSNMSLFSAYFGVVSLNSWNKLSPELQKILLDAGKKAQLFNFEAAEREDKLSSEKVQKMGMIFNRISDKEQDRWLEASKAKFFDLYRKGVGEEKARKMFDSVEELRKKY